MSDEVISSEQLSNYLNLLKLALYQPRLYVNNFLDELINEIDIHSQLASENEEIDLKELLNQQEQMINYITEFKEACLSDLSDDQYPKQNLQTIIDKIEIDLKSGDNETKLEEINKKISYSLLAIQKVIFKNQSIHLIKDSDTCNMVQTKRLPAVLYVIEDDFIKKEIFQEV